MPSLAIRLASHLRQITEQRPTTNAHGAAHVRCGLVRMEIQHLSLFERVLICLWPFPLRADVVRSAVDRRAIEPPAPVVRPDNVRGGQLRGVRDESQDLLGRALPRENHV
jgi:hypothetical protein